VEEITVKKDSEEDDGILVLLARSGLKKIKATLGEIGRKKKRILRGSKSQAVIPLAVLLQVTI
jgi:hypothetical protein